MRTAIISGSRAARRPAKNRGAGAVHPSTGFVSRRPQQHREQDLPRRHPEHEAPRQRRPGCPRPSCHRSPSTRRRSRGSRPCRADDGRWPRHPARLPTATGRRAATRLGSGGRARCPGIGRRSARCPPPVPYRRRRRPDRSRRGGVARPVPRRPVATSMPSDGIRPSTSPREQVQAVRQQQGQRLGRRRAGQRMEQETRIEPGDSGHRRCRDRSVGKTEIIQPRAQLGNAQPDRHTRPRPAYAARSPRRPRTAGSAARPRREPSARRHPRPASY